MHAGPGTVDELTDGVTDPNKGADTQMDQIQLRTEHGGKIEPSICPRLCAIQRPQVNPPCILRLLEAPFREESHHRHARKMGPLLSKNRGEGVRWSPAVGIPAQDWCHGHEDCEERVFDISNNFSAIRLAPLAEKKRMMMDYHGLSGLSSPEGSS